MRRFNQKPTTHVIRPPHLLYLVEEGAVRIIARAANRTTSVDVVRLCASTLCNFAGEGRARPKMSDSRTAQVTRKDYGTHSIY